ncbi:hypothetical protein HJC23_000099 [Cyclotella cryptica]|uniref:Uncharacterized protein n=1 Tax=Cyclotella cryptica TaxID=29204 RepID=A0ABD3PBA5_9STRA
MVLYVVLEEVCVSVPDGARSVAVAAPFLREPFLWEKRVPWIKRCQLRQVKLSSRWRRRVSLNAKHANNKAAKKANHNRPRKSRPSDIHRKPTDYPTWVNPPEYTIIDDSYVDGAMPEEEFVKESFLDDSIACIQRGGEHTGWVVEMSGQPLSAFGPMEWEKVPQGGPEFLVEEMGSIDMEHDGSEGEGGSGSVSVNLPEGAELVEMKEGQQLVFY